MAHYNYDVMKLVELSKNDNSLVTLEATVITGFESLAMEECQEKCKPVNICRAKGRIYFNILLDNFPSVMKLRAVDNVFLVNSALGKITLYKDKEKDLEVIQNLVEKVDWGNTLATWSKLTEFDGILFPLENTAKKTENLAISEIDGKYDNLSNNNLICSNEIINTDLEINILPEKPLIDLNGLSLYELAHPMPEEKGESNENDLPKRRNSVSSEDSFYSVESIECNTCGVAESGKSLVCPLTSVSNKSTIPTTNNVQSEADNLKKTKKDVDPNILKFRATCNRTGQHSFSSMEAAANFGGRLHDKFNWTVNLDNFNLNVILNINSDLCYVCSAITPKSLHRRNITHFGYTTLRSTMCYNLIRLAEPTKGEIVIDPLCGGGSIPIEGALSFKNTFHICGDNNFKAINRAALNIEHIRKTQSLLVDPLKWSAKRLPLRDQCVDVFVTDLPFGKRSGKRSDNLNLYKNVLSEMARVIRCGTGRAVLLSNDKTSLSRAIGGSSNPYWRQINSFGVNQGGLFSTVFLLLRTSKPYLL